jgi:hypothetical protein
LNGGLIRQLRMQQRCRQQKKNDSDTGGLHAIYQVNANALTYKEALWISN